MSYRDPPSCGRKEWEGRGTPSFKNIRFLSTLQTPKKEVVVVEFPVFEMGSTLSDFYDTDINGNEVERTPRLKSTTLFFQLFS